MKYKHIHQDLNIHKEKGVYYKHKELGTYLHAPGRIDRSLCQTSLNTNT